MSLGFGVTSTINLDLVQRIAPAVERAGFSMFWSNDIPGGSSFDVLAAAAGVTEHVQLANGIVPIDRVPPSEWKEQIERAGLAGDRFIAGIGSGRLDKPLRPLSEAIDTIRGEAGVRVVLGALRRNMRRLAAERADGVLLNWLTPEFAAKRQEAMLEKRHDAGVSQPFLTAAFVRVAIGDAAIDRLRHEAARYESFPAYARHFTEMGVSAIDTAVAARTVDEAADGLVPFLRSLDHPVLRCVVAEERDDAYLELVESGRRAMERA